MKLSIKQLVATCAIILFSTAGFSQTARQAAQASMFHDNLTLQSQMQKNFAAIYKANVEGTPYYDEEFNSANISPMNKVYLVRYNAALDDMEVIQSSDTLIMNKNNRNYVIKQNKGSITYKILECAENKKDEKLGYYVALTEGTNVALYRKDRKKFVEVKKAAYGGNLNASSAKFKKQKSEFYIELNKSGNAIEFPRKKKDVIKMFPGKEDLVEKYIKKNKIKVTKEEDLKKLISYVNSL
ncbi:hypothetical protein IMCC3317_32800 [Kordia antarctica]|uniref:Uncharacterized protein n=1 Tax=Kordia antarctica TaxID=1218801 RepID=A0A7L4ZN37_9FLAO|nr:hypothetical protein [Kordia antarctica]QHI37897.1 hypothetical protein IMCC3317_32800 [Kordia antarctica]